MKHLLIVLMLLFAGADTGAQPQAAPPEARAGRPRAAGLSPADVEDMFDALSLVQAEQFLQVSESVYPEFVTRLKNLQQIRKRHRHARNQILRELQRLTAPQRGAVDEAILRERLKALAEQGERAQAELDRAYAALDEVLDVRQQARFRVLEQNLERMKLDMLVRARQRAARGRS